MQILQVPKACKTCKNIPHIKLQDDYVNLQDAMEQIYVLRAVCVR